MFVLVLPLKLGLAGMLPPRPPEDWRRLSMDGEGMNLAWEPVRVAWAIGRMK